MKRTVIIWIIILSSGFLYFTRAQETLLAGTWKLVSYKYILPDCSEEDLVIQKAVRVYNDTHFSVFWVYPDSTTETCVARYSLDGDKLQLKILSHSDLRSYGRELTGVSKITGNRLFHFVDIDGYIIMEIYEPLTGDHAGQATNRPDAGSLHLMATELIRHARNTGNIKLVNLGETYRKEALKTDPSLINVVY